MEGPMLQSLLADRFKLSFHRETQQLPVYELTRAGGSTTLQHRSWISQSSGNALRELWASWQILAVYRRRSSPWAVCQHVGPVHRLYNGRGTQAAHVVHGGIADSDSFEWRW